MVRNGEEDCSCLKGGNSLRPAQTEVESVYKEGYTRQKKDQERKERNRNEMARGGGGEGSAELRYET